MRTLSSPGALTPLLQATRLKRHFPQRCALWATLLVAYWQGGLVGVFSRTAGTLICSLGCWLGLSELAGTCAGLGPPGVWSGAEAVVTTCCCMSFCWTT